MVSAGASACTDITGFGLFGHLLRLARQSRLTARIFAEALPAFAGVIASLRDGVAPGAVERNREYVGEKLRVETNVDEVFVHLGCDPQTSGGLLIAISPARLPALLSALAKTGATGFVIGQFTTPSEGGIHLVRSALESDGSEMFDQSDAPAKPAPAQKPMNPPPHSADCCADVFPGHSGSAVVAEAQKAFGAMMRAIQTGGALDARTKELILFSLVVLSRCAPCFRAHVEKARALGISKAELDEAAWCAIALGGAPVRMFYQECTED